MNPVFVVHILPGNGMSDIQQFLAQLNKKPEQPEPIPLAPLKKQPRAPVIPRRQKARPILFMHTTFASGNTSLKLKGLDGKNATYSAT